MIRNHHIAALLASVALSACSGPKQETAQQASTEIAPLKPGFYKAANGSAAVFDVPNGPYKYVKGISESTCVRVTKNSDAGDFVRVDILGAERALFDPGDKYIRRDELKLAPACESLAATFDTGVASLKAGQGYVLKYDTPLHGENLNTINGYLSQGDCVRMGENPADARTVRVEARIPGTIMTGSVDVYAINPAKTCKLAP